MGNCRGILVRSNYRFDPSGALTSQQYDLFGNVTHVTDPLGNITKYTYNNWDLLVNDNQLIGTDPATSQGAARTYIYDAVGNLRNFTDRRGKSISYDYDPAYNMTKETWVGGSNIINYAYDLLGNLTQAVDSSSNALVFKYDKKNQVVGEMSQYGNIGTNLAVNLARTYDDFGNQTQLRSNFAGSMSYDPALQTVNFQNGKNDLTRDYSYDALGRMTTVSQHGSGGSNAVTSISASFSYNLDDQLTDIRRYASASPDANTMKVHSRFGYDGSGRLSSITHADTQIASGQSWNGTSQVPSSIGSGQMLAAYFLSYDGADRLSSMSSYFDRFTTTYGYDSRSQLTSAASSAIAGLSTPSFLPTTESYGFDANGNRSGTQTQAGTHNRIQSDGTYEYLYDTEGNTTKRTEIASGAVREMEWDYRGRMSKLTERSSSTGAATKVVEYTYDPLDRLIAEKVIEGGSAEVTAKIWDGDHVLMTVESIQAGGGEGVATGLTAYRVAKRFLHGPMVDMVLAEETFSDGKGPIVAGNGATVINAQSRIGWTLGDHLGSIRDVLQDNGDGTTTRQHIVYDSFGRRVNEQQTLRNNSSGAVTGLASTDSRVVDAVFGYTGREWDKETELQYNRARWYDPSTGRWLSQDPIGFGAGDANLYRYVGNRATNSTDPSGLEEYTPFMVEWWRTGRYRYELFQQGHDFYILKYDVGNFFNVFATTEFVSRTDIKGDPKNLEYAQYLLSKKKALEKIASGAQAVLDTGQAVAATGFFIATVFVPGPEDLVLAALASRYGITVAKGVFYRGGKQLAGKEATEAGELAVRLGKEFSGPRGQIMSRASKALEPLKTKFPDARIGFRGSLGRGTKGSRKGNAPFDPNNYDVDAFIVSDTLASQVAKDANGFRNLGRLTEHQMLIKTISDNLRRIPGHRDAPVKIRVFSESEFKALSPDECFIIP